MPDTFTPEQIAQILEAFFAAVGTRQYIGARYVPIFGRKDETSIIWDNSAPYEPLTIVLYQGNSFTSRQYVPAGVEITNQEFWAETGNYNAQIEEYRRIAANALQTANTALENASAAQTDINNLLPKSDFSVENTVKEYVDKHTTTFDTVDAMKNAAFIQVGQTYYTNGFYASGDGGAGSYIITENATANDMDVIEISDNLYATLIVDKNNSISLSQIGLPTEYADPIDDYINKGFELSNSVYIPSGDYYIREIIVPENGELFGTLPDMKCRNGSVVHPYTINTPIYTDRKVSIHDIAFMESDLCPTSIDSINKNYDYLIKNRRDKASHANDNVHIYNVFLYGCNKGFEFVNIRRVEIDHVYGSYLTTCLHFDAVYEFTNIHDCFFNNTLYNNVDTALDFNFENYVEYVRAHSVFLYAQRMDYPTISNISIFVGRYFIYAEKSSTGSFRNAIVSDISTDAVGTFIGTPNTNNDHVRQAVVSDCVITTASLMNRTIQDPAYVGARSENSIWGEYAIDIYGNSPFEGVTFTNLTFSGCGYSCIHASNVFVSVANSIIRNPADNLAFSGESDWNDNPVYIVSGESNAKLYIINNLIEQQHTTFINFTRLVKSDGTANIKFSENSIGQYIYGQDNEYLKYKIEYIDNYLDSHGDSSNVITVNALGEFTPMIPCNQKNILQFPMLGANGTLQLPIEYLAKFNNVFITFGRWGGMSALYPIAFTNQNNTSIIVASYYTNTKLTFEGDSAINMSFTLNTNGLLTVNTASADIIPRIIVS